MEQESVNEKQYHYYMAINYNKHIWEGWTVQDFIDELSPLVETIMAGHSWVKPFKTKEDIAVWIKDNQPYYKKRIPEVINHFSEKYNLR